MGSMSETWGEAILRIVRAKPGVISLPEIYQEMEQHPLVTAHHKKPWTDDTPNYKHWIRSELKRLKDRGRIRHVGRSLYTSN